MNTRLAISPITSRVYTAKMKDKGNGLLVPTGHKADVSEDFMRCLAQFRDGNVEFEIDGVRFKATCELIDDGEGEQ